MSEEERNIVGESDVEQKVAWPLLTAAPPEGLGYPVCSVVTKRDIRGYHIGKGTERKLYYPDYVCQLLGIPVLIVEVKAPGEDLAEAFREARLYAAEVNSQFPTGYNPARFVACLHDSEIWVGAWDNEAPELVAGLGPSMAVSAGLSKVLNRVSHSALLLYANELRQERVLRPFGRPVNLVGGQSVRDEEIGLNEFGASIALNYRHIFNPSTRADRRNIVRKAYVSSNRRDKYTKSIDRLVHAALPSSVLDAALIQDTSRPAGLLEQLATGRQLKNQILLLIGAVGVGKSTFVDYLREVALPDATASQLTWVRADMNAAPLSRELIYDWLCEQVIDSMSEASGGVDLEALEMLLKIYSVEVRRLQKGALKLLGEGSIEYRRILSEELLRLEASPTLRARALLRHFGAERARLPIVVLDNCDKRVRDEQLLMFEVAQWAQEQFQCLVFLPLRDVTYDLHRSAPPLDAALKDLTFRIEAPSFARVLQKRIALALAEMAESFPEKERLSYRLPNDIRVEYPSTDQGVYLACIMRSVFEHDRSIRRLMAGLAGRDLRKAMEVFLDFCRSGHIGTDLIYKMRANQGEYKIPFHIIMRVLLRQTYRFYQGDRSHLKNLFQCDPEDDVPSHFARIHVLKWLQGRLTELGPTGVKGYHPLRDLLNDLSLLGVARAVATREVNYFLRAGLILIEHMTFSVRTEDDLVRLAPSGSVHLRLLSNPSYLGAVAEDLWWSDRAAAQKVAGRIGRVQVHYREETRIRNAQEVSAYLRQQHLDVSNAAGATVISDLEQLAVAGELSEDVLHQHCENRLRVVPWLLAEDRFPTGSQHQGTVESVHPKHGVFVSVAQGVTGLIHRDDGTGWEEASACRAGDRVQVSVLRVNEERKRLSLAYVAT